MSENNVSAVTELQLPDLKSFKKGKVRHMYDFGDTLLMVATDRISAFDCILPQGIPGKGRILTQVSKFWFDVLKQPHHMISTHVSDFPGVARQYADILEGRSMLVKKTELVPVECVVRGYLAGSGWKDYQKTGTVCGHKLPAGLRLADKLPEPIFTPATKNDSGHDENISVTEMRDKLGSDLTAILENRSLEIYRKASEIADAKGIIIGDTKFEFGLLDSGVLLIDEVLTPDSSRFWAKDKYEVGISPPSFDKQIVRDYLESTDWDKTPPPPDLPEEITTKTAREYRRIADLLTGR
ncbi:MAG: phosphoribosylaminoimidazolesuccinocarboxamide synthase [bacterium]|nr:phosphoribosylaminoimidazolesuccinocarboxamide synthase [bacterium]